MGGVPLRGRGGDEIRERGREDLRDRRAVGRLHHEEIVAEADQRALDRLHARIGLRGRLHALGERRDGLGLRLADIARVVGGQVLAAGGGADRGELLLEREPVGLAHRGVAEATGRGLVVRVACVEILERVAGEAGGRDALRCARLGRNRRALDDEIERFRGAAEAQRLHGVERAVKIDSLDHRRQLGDEDDGVGLAEVRAGGRVAGRGRERATGVLDRAGIGSRPNRLCVLPDEGGDRGLLTIVQGSGGGNDGSVEVGRLPERGRPAEREDRAEDERAEEGSEGHDPDPG